MNKLDIPFNLDLLFIDEKASMMMRPVSSLSTFVGATKNFDPAGLFSTEIFGVVGTDARYNRFSYIDLKVPIIHPTLFKALGQIKALYLDILARRAFAVWDPELKDLVKSDMNEGETGFDFFCKYLPRIEFPNNNSEARQIAVSLMGKYRNKALISRVLMLPAGFREFEIDEATGRESSSEINDYYYKLISAANTVNTSTIKVSPQAYDMQRMSMQNTMMELYDLLSKVIEGKNNLLMGKMAGRKVFNGTRNVITSMTETIKELGNPRNISMNDTLVGLFQFAKSIQPVTVSRIRTDWIDKCFTVAGAPVLLTDPKTMQSDSVTLSAMEYNKWISAEGIEKILSYYREETIRHSPIMIEGKYLGLVYRGPDKTFAFIHGIEELPDDCDPKQCSPITYTDLIYHALYRDARKFVGLVTRYPITGIGSIYPSRAYLKTTIRSEQRVELDPETWKPYADNRTAYEFPVVGSAFFNSLSPHPTRLARLGADFDGDTCSWTCLYSDEALAESENFFTLKRAYVGTDGRFINSVSIDTVEFVLANLTGP